MTIADIEQLRSDGVSESIEIEFKQELPARDRRSPDGWQSRNDFGEFARNAIAAEIVAFANTLGGAVVVGIEESDDHPKRARAVAPLPRAHELARRLRQAIYDIIDPPLPMLEAAAVEVPNTGGSGVVVLRVPPSRGKPHRLQSNREVYIRREDESVKIGMRQIQELTIQSLAEANRVDSILSQRGIKFREGAANWLKENHAGSSNYAGSGLHMIAVPTTTLDLGRVAGRPELTTFPARTVVRFGDDNYACHFPFGPGAQWRPGLRSISSEYVDGLFKSEYRLETSGICEVSVVFVTNDDRPGLFAEWLLGALGRMLCWIDRVRTSTGNVAGEFALAVQMPIFGRDIILVRYGETHFSKSSSGTIPIGYHQFPTMSIGESEEFSQHLRRFDEDIWNLAGQEVRRTATETFELTC